VNINPVLSDFVSQFVVACIPLLVTGIAYVARQVVNYVKSKTSAEQYALLERLARQAVQAVEQTLKSKPGAEKRAAAVAAVRGALLAKGIKLDEGAIISAVESAVYANTGVVVSVSSVQE
jgi:LL-H family phage holin